LTAAHKTLPFGTKVRVYNPSNKKSVDVVIIDRGPFIKGRVIELSRRAAQQIDLIKATVAPVELTVLSSPNSAVKAQPTAANKPAAPAPAAKSTTSTSSSRSSKTDPPKEGLVVEAKDMQTGGLYKMQVLKLESTGFGVQVAGYSDYESVVQQLAVLQRNWFKGATVFVDELNGKPYYKVILGPMTTRAEASSYCENIKKKYNVEGAFVVDLGALAAQRR
jgi:rare lipoprotein A